MFSKKKKTLEGIIFYNLVYDVICGDSWVILCGSPSIIQERLDLNKETKIKTFFLIFAET